MNTCPNGHRSDAGDYCDVCGSRIGAAAAYSADPATGAPDDAGRAADAGIGDDEITCPHCAITQDAGHRFCEVCGADLTSGAPGPSPAPPSPAVDVAGARWEVEVAPDRAFFDRLAADGVEFPDAIDPRSYPLADAVVLVGRRSERRGIRPQIDLTGASEDPGISHAHCRFLRQPDGSFVLVDSGSTNGTFVNDATTPIARDGPVPVADGDRVHIGAYTTLTVRRR